MPTKEDDRKELQRRLEQAIRMAKAAGDPVTKERLAGLASELEAQLKE